MNQKKYRPTNETLKKVIDYLESIHLNVYGAACDLDKSIETEGGCMDYSAEQVIRYRSMTEEKQ